MSGAATEPLPGTPEAEVEIDADLARALLRAQHPDLADLPIEPADTGWDNVMFRLGDRYALRLPRRALAAALIEHEQRWLPRLADTLPIPVPAPIRVGRPGEGYPWPWSVLPWIEGVTADLDPPGADQAERLAAFLCALHADAPADAPANRFRSVPLQDRVDAVEPRLQRLEAKTDLITETVWRIWEDALAASVDTKRTWTHGDIHHRNVVVSGGVIRGIIDWGDIAAGDRATDLGAIWSLLPDPASRRRAMDACGDVSEATWRRAKGWAVLFGAILLDTGLVDHPAHAAIGETILRRVAEGP